ncbi:uncharacterized protein LOC126740102 isoform X2 [Anthonomus grandis grandis]|uniref:uncharacterized protein LOC126740102 isoform X2 n=1 Tax=Anthonomus grandis grandis TaxID=2921223 RepID=UPI00216687F3|nr:uncharacterized protein LOC126740102 isoform X2 [Anthonomus grandis grandis]
MTKVGINGFGRTGKSLLKAILERQPIKMKPMAINDPALQSPKHAAYILKYDSVYDRFYGKVCYDEKHLIVNDEKILIFAEADSKKIPWSQSDVVYVADCSGKNTTLKTASQHLTGKVKKIIVAGNSKDISMFVMGVNHMEYNPSEKVISMASCSTNCLAPLVKVMHEKFGIREGFVTVVHAITNEQNLLDGMSNKSWRIGRCSILNIIPDKSCCIEGIGGIIPDLKEKISEF